MYNIKKIEKSIILVQYHYLDFEKLDCPTRLVCLLGRWGFFESVVSLDDVEGCICGLMFPDNTRACLATFVATITL